MKAEHSRKKGRGRIMTFLVNPKILNQSGKQQHLFDFGRYYITFFGERLKGKGEDSFTNSVDMNLSKPQQSGGQGILACFCPWDCKELDVTEWLINNSNNRTFIYFYLPFKQHSLKWTSTIPAHMIALFVFSLFWLFLAPWTVACQAPLSMGF